MRHLPIGFVACALSLTFAAIACSSDPSDEPPTAQEKAAYCRDVAATRESLFGIRAAMVPYDEAAMQDARAEARASIDYLDSSARELQGGDDLVANLREDLQRFQELMATPDLISVRADLQAQLEVIESDLDVLDAAGNCGQ